MRRLTPTLTGARAHLDTAAMGLCAQPPCPEGAKLISPGQRPGDSASHTMLRPERARRARLGPWRRLRDTPDQSHQSDRSAPINNKDPVLRHQLLRPDVQIGIIDGINADNVLLTDF